MAGRLCSGRGIMLAIRRPHLAEIEAARLRSTGVTQSSDSEDVAADLATKHLLQDAPSGCGWCRAGWRVADSSRRAAGVPLARNRLARARSSARARVVCGSVGGAEARAPNAARALGAAEWPASDYLYYRPYIIARRRCSPTARPGKKCASRSFI